MSQITLLDTGWKFHLGDIPPSEPVWGFLKAGAHNQSGAAKALDDSRWREVRIPHDFVMEQPPTPSTRPAGTPHSAPEMDYLADLHVLHGCRAGNVAWYRKHLRVDAPGKRVYLQFDGVFRASQLFVNQFYVGSHLSGYTEALYDITDFLTPGGDNLIALRVDARLGEGWYYEGGGIYRPVWLILADPVSIDHHGVWAKAELDLERDEALLTIRTTVSNRSGEPVEATVSHRLQAPNGQETQLPGKKVALEGWDTQTVEHTLTLPHPQRWDLDTPQLYTLESLVDGNPDTSTTFGVRHIRFDKDHGFYLNGRPVKLKGVCCHQDHGGLGVAIPDGIWEYRIRKLKEMGCNAYRCSHHPASPALLDACDRLGILVMDENRLLSSSQEDLGQLRQLVLCGRNHPSVILWSIGNEESHIQFTPQARQIAATMRNVIRSLDDSRPVTAAVCMWEAGHCNEVVTDPDKQGMLAPSVDVFGFNYFADVWDDFHHRHPDLPLIVTEDSTFSETRGCRHTRADLGHLCAADKSQGNYRAGERSWKDAQREYLAGTFVWTGFDYYGEPAPYGWPAVSTQFGIMDLCGFPKDTYYYYKSWWGNEDVLHLTPGEDGLWCFTNCQEVELWSDGVCLGRKAVEKNSLLEWPGVSPRQPLTAVGYRDGQEVLRRERLPWGPAKSLNAWVDGSFPERDGSRTVVVNIALLDESGNLAEDGDNKVFLELPGQGELLGLANGDPSCHESPKGPCFSAFHGLMQAVLRVTGEGVLRLHAAGLEGTEITL
ncbi:MAG: glycoside hydrolase family 2 TIM barrel-domain containing protein [Acutalibacter sp.]